MNTKVELGHIAGVAIVLDMLFVLVLILFGSGYFMSGSVVSMSIGIVVVAGTLASILLHEVGHALAARIWGVRTSMIELGGLGGRVHFTRSLPASVLARTVVYLAGPAANLALWLGLEQLAPLAMVDGAAGVGVALWTLAAINFGLMVFNLLPAFPLDGGRTLDVWISAIFGGAWGARVIGSLGMAVAIGIGFYALPSNLRSPPNMWMILIAIILFAENMQRVQSVGWPRWRR